MRSLLGGREHCDMAAAAALRGNPDKRKADVHSRGLTRRRHRIRASTRQFGCARQVAFQFSTIPRNHEANLRTM